MLDTETKRRIDTARDILVGKVPDPKSQVEQITIALIYKFMDDMDAESEELGGKRKFFTGDFARYGWAKLMAPSLGGHEMLAHYGEGIAKMTENPGLPPLFRDIFKNAYLPYRDPETLRAFLKIIDAFTYDHSERLGDAFEYLLSVLGSQGDAGQFRTPRHIIDFIVEILQPKKTETVLDPACGTAGFLVSAYKYILRENSTREAKAKSDQKKEALPKEDRLHTSALNGAPGDRLTPDEKGSLAQNIRGYDISPDMVRLSLVNLYLHGFADPHVYEYDSLTSEERWNECADVILANPPFMSPKGGIKPHKRFSVQSKRSEVLFVDYIAEHLTPAGRAGIIVPEGIIFQSQTAYKQLRKMLVENYLVAVISLPAGVFQPYSGVKTSILILNKSLARQSNTVAFYKVENDGFGLGAQRRPIDKNDLPAAKAAIMKYEGGIMKGEDVLDPDFMTHNSPLLIVPKAKIAENGDYNLSGERYREVVAGNSKFPWVELRKIILGKPEYGSGARKAEYDGSVRYIRITDITERGILKDKDLVSPSTIEKENFLQYGDLLIARSGSVGRTYLHSETTGLFQYAGYLIRFRIDPSKALPAFVFQITQSPHWSNWIISHSKTGTISNINAKQYSSFKLPLPPLEVQKEIVAEIEGYQKVIDGSRAVLDNYRPHIPIHPEWPMVELGEVFRLSSGRGLTQSNMKSGPYPVYGGNGKNGMHSEYFQEAPNIVIGRVGAYCGAVHITEPKSWITDNALYITEFKKEIDIGYLAQMLVQLNLNQFAKVGGQPSISQSTVCERIIPLPPLEIQRSIVAEIEAEQELVNANRELITRMEKKIQQTLARVWGEEDEKAERAPVSEESELLAAEAAAEYAGKIPN